uniref:(northern house mosquito) hypothetical protein n=1 Tax=Culex pipiens TaxID=7175 RepID=A0A8D8MTK2_CULPI
MHQLSERVHRTKRTERKYDRTWLGEPSGRGYERYRDSGSKHHSIVEEAGQSGGNFPAISAALGQRLPAAPTGLDHRGERHRVRTEAHSHCVLSLPVRGGGSAAQETKGRPARLLRVAPPASATIRVPVLGPKSSHTKRKREREQQG